MKTSDTVISNNPDRTDLGPGDHERFFEAVDFPPLPTEALRAAFLRNKVQPKNSYADLLPKS